MSKAVEVYKRLRKEYGTLKSSLNYKKDYEFFIAAILSANSTDKVVNKVTPLLFKKYNSLEKLAKAPITDIEKIIKPIGLYRQKARYIKESARLLLQRKGKIPKSLEELQKFPGVGRKVANVILSQIHGINEGIAVDTHVKRLSYRLGLTSHKDPVKIERDLMQQLPKKYWWQFSLLLINHGRKICKSQKPLCGLCVLSDICPKKGLKNKREI